MRQETKVFTYYKFSELSDKAKENAVNNLYYINVYHDWWEFIYEDAENIGLKITGFDIGRNNYCTGEWLAKYSCNEVANKILAQHGEMCETYKIAKEYLMEQTSLVAKYSDGKNLEIVAEDNEYDYDNEIEEIENEFLKSLLCEYLTMLRNECEYLTSKQGIIEIIEANDCEFDENGKMAYGITWK